jgi:D-amino peptidase
MRLYISADMEGIVGVVTRDHLSPDGFEYQRARVWYSDTVAAACEAAHEAGCSEIVVSDSHGNGESLLIERLPPYVQLIRSWPRPLMMMQGVEEGAYVGAMLIGYHTGASNPSGILAHTIHASAFQEIRLNGRVMSEAGISAALAGEYGVPVLLASGDDHAMTEIASLIEGVHTVTLKWSYGTKSSRMLSPALAHDRIRAGVSQALANPRGKPFVLEPPISLDIVFRHRMPAEYLSYLDIARRLDAHTIRFVGKSMDEVSRFIAFVTGYQVMAVM